MPRYYYFFFFLSARVCGGGGVAAAVAASPVSNLYRTVTFNYNLAFGGKLRKEKGESSL